MTCDETFDALARRESDPAKQKAIDEHLAGCEECRTMKEGLAAFDEAHEHPERFSKDPPHVRDAILAKAHAMAAELRREHERGGDAAAGPALRVLEGGAASPRASPRALLAAAALVACLAVGFVIGRATAPSIAVPEPQDGPTVSVHSGSRGGGSR